MESINTDDLLFDKQQNALLHCPKSFRGICRVSPNVTIIGIQAFFGCSNLLSVELPLGLKTINMMAFEGCRHLNSITIPASVETIGFRGFAKCDNLTSMRLMHKIPPVCYAADNIFAETQVNHCILYVPKGSGIAYQLAPVWNDFHEIIEYEPASEKVFESYRHLQVG